MRSTTARSALRVLTKLALAVGLAATGAAPAFAVDLHYGCGFVNVAHPDTGVLLRKNPNTPAARNATATVLRLAGGPAITIQAGTASCFAATVGASDYCFVGRTSAQIAQVNAVASNNHLGAPACH